jgi:hypothetical protein
LLKKLSYLKNKRAMRYLIYSLFVVVMLSLYSCDTSKSTENENDAVALMKPNWGDTVALAKSIDIFYTDSVLKRGKVSLEVRDPFLRKGRPNQYLQLYKIKRPDFKLFSPTIGYMPVLMLSGNDSSIVDFQITWQQPNPKDSLGKFVVTDKFLQTTKNQPRYEWVKENEYWIRKNTEAPKSKDLLESQGENKLNSIKKEEAI